MKYTKETYIKMDKDTNTLLHFLQECKFSGSWDTKIDLNVIIKKISNYQFMLNSLLKEVEELEKKVNDLKVEKENQKDE